MADRRIQYELSFDAKTSRAKAQIKDLQSQLNSLANAGLNRPDLDYSGQIGKSVKAVNQLQSALEQATNVKTGKLDLSKFNDSLKTSGLNLEYFQKNLSALGPKGQQAFLSLTQSIVTADASLVKTSKLLQDMKTSLSNTVKWQISSSAIHGLMGAIQGAYGYAQDLNKSLTDIRIVTGQSTDQMAEFAKQANNSAKALSISTTKYAEAALIYYQQGLTDEQVKARTDTTVKMANVTGENAADVSSYMTAIWNNFAKGSDNLEYFSDVITALGAATAASSEEIAGGLEKFAAVGETVGLSYEYATAALTTIIDKTRQSEDVVGTALKTIFARIQGLQQGETQDDGVTLNKYSSALANVGIQIMDTSGELKAMDDILDELGAKWQTLGKAEQVALAQTVGGTRQYTQLIALMDNWGAMQENLNVAYTSEGALQEQADIYAESWEAAQSRVTAALQDIYDSLLNDDFFIDLTNIFADLLEYIGNFIDSLGGMRGTLALISTVLLNIFGEELQKGFKVAESWVNRITGKTKKDIEETRLSAVKLARDTAASMDQNSQGGIISRTADLYDAIGKKIDKLNDAQKQELNNALEINRVLQERTTELVKQQQQEEKNLARQKTQVLLDLGVNQEDEIDKEIESAKKIGKVQQFTGFLSTKGKDLQILNKDEEYQKRIQTYLGMLDELETEGVAQAKIVGQKIIDAIAGNINEKEFEEALNKLEEELDNSIEEMILTMPNAGESFNNLIHSAADSGAIEMEKELSVLNEQAANSQIKDWLDNIGKSVASAGDKIIAGAQAISAFTSVIDTLKGSWETITDPNLSGWEKISAVVSAATSVIMTMKFALTETTAALIKDTAIKGANAASNILLGKSMFVASEGAWTLKLALWEIVVVAIAVAAAIAAVVFIAKSIYEWFNKDKIAMEKANEELENSKKAADEAASAYDDLKSSIDSLQSAEETLSKLTKGTTEWKEAVLKVNQQVLDLIDKYPELAKYMTNEDGVLGISEEGLNAQLSQQMNEANALQGAVLSDQRNKMVLQNSQNNKLKDIDYIVGTSASDMETKTLSTQDQIDILNQAEKFGAILEDGTVNFQKLNKETNNAYIEYMLYQNEFNDSIQDIRQMRETIAQTDAELQKFDKNIASSWLNSQDTGYSSEYNDFLATGMSKHMADARANLPTDLDDTQAREAYAKMMLGPEATDKAIADYVTKLDEKVKEDSTFQATMEEALINASASLASYKAVQGQVDLAESYKNQAGYETLKNIMASGGDVSSYNALTETEAEAFRTLVKQINSDGNMETLFGNTEIFGEGFIQKLTETFSEGNKEEYEAQSKENREKIFSQKASARASELGVDEGALEAYAKSLQKLNPKLEDNADAALDAAEANIRWNNGIENLSEVLDDNADALKESNKGTWDYYEALGKVQEAASDLLGIEVSTQYAEDHLEDFKKAVKGDEEAIRTLQQTAAYDWAQTFVKGIDESAIKVDNWTGQFLDAVKQAGMALGGLDTDVTLTADASQVTSAADQSIASMIDLANQAMAAGQMTEAQMREMFNSMGYSPEVDYIPVPQTTNTSGSFSVGPKDDPWIEVPYFSSVTTDVMVPKIQDANGDGTTTLTKITTPKSLSTTATPTTKGGSGSSKKDKKKASDEIERYHEIKETIQSLEKELDRLSKAKDRAYGQDKLDLMDKEIAKTEELKVAQEDYLKQIRANYKKDRAAAAGIGAVFDEQGNISNWDEIRQKALDKFNNSARTDKDEEEYNRIKEILDQYEETHDLLMEEEDKLEDYINEITDAKIAKIQYEVEVKVDIEETELEYLDHLLSKLEDKEFSAAETMALLGKQTQSWLDKYKANVEGLHDTINELGISLDDAIGIMIGKYTKEEIDALGLTEEQLKTIREYGAEFINIAQALDQLKDSFTQELIDAINEGVDAYAQLGEEINHVTSTLEHYQNLIDILGEEALGIGAKEVAELMQSTVDSSIANLANSQKSLEWLKSEREKLTAALEGASDENKESINKALKNLDEQIRSAESQAQSDLESVLNMIVEQFTLHVKQATDAFEKAMSGTFGSLDKLQEAFDRQKELDDLYIDDYKKVYELTKLTRDIGKSIDETDNLKAKQALRDLQKEINDLQKDGIQLSEYDIDMLNKKYELQLAQIALEEAQNAKSQVRMTRDSEGNWSYTYTADENNIAEAEQNYEDKLYAMQELNQEYLKNLQGQILAAQAAMSQAIRDLGPNAGPEEVAAITQHYQAIIDAHSQQMQNALGDSNYALGFMTEETEGWVNSFDETALSTMTGFESLESYQAAFAQSTQQMADDIGKAFETYNINVDKAMETAELSVEGFGETLGKVQEQAKEDLDEIAEDSELLSKDVTKNVGDALAQLQEFYDTYGASVESATDETWGLVEALKALSKAQAQQAQEKPEDKPKDQKPEQDSSKPTWEKVKSAYDKINSGAWGTGHQRIVDGKADGFTEAEISLAQKLINKVYGGMSLSDAKKAIGFATGGYTGAWGPSGRLAMLHEKELVLNPEDTINMLKTIDIVRDISNLIDLNAANSMFSTLTTTAMPVGNQGITQEITINAEFPDATDRDEISAAFDSLFIRASQYANRKIR